MCNVHFIFTTELIIDLAMPYPSHPFLSFQFSQRNGGGVALTYFFPIKYFLSRFERENFE